MDHYEDYDPMGKNPFNIFNFLSEKKQQEAMLNLTQEQKERKARRAGRIASIGVFIAGLEIDAGLQSVKSFFSTEVISRNPIMILLHMFPHRILNLMLIGAFSFVAYRLVKAMRMQSLMKHTIRIDAEGRKVDLQGSLGRSHLQFDEEKSKYFDIRDPKDPDGIILGKSKKDGSLLTLPWDLNKLNRIYGTLNIGVIGSSGSGKTVSAIIPAIFSNLMAGNNVICTDPKGELYEKTSAAARYCGYNVQVFNVSGEQFMNSNGWDIIKLVRASNAPEATADLIAEIITDNTKSVERYWGPGTQNLLSMLILYVAKGEGFRPYQVRQSTSEEFFNPTGFSPKGLLEELDKLMPTSIDHADINSGEYDDGYEEDYDVDSYRTFDELIRLITDPDVGIIVKTAIDNHPETDGELLQARFETWAGGEHPHQMRSSLATALTKYLTHDVRKVLSIDEIDFNKIASEKTIVYVVCSDTNDTYKPILTLFLNFLFIELMKIADRSGGKLSRLHHIIIEEFGAVGKIPGFDRYLAVMRSRNIATMYCMQEITMLVDMYSDAKDGKYQYNSIISNTPLWLYTGQTGSNPLGPDSKEFFSRRSGNMTILEYRNSEDRNKIFSEELQNMFVLDRKQTVSEKQMPVLMPDQIGDMATDDILISPHRPASTIEKKYFYKDHPLANVQFVNARTKQIVTPNSGRYVPAWRSEPSDLDECEAIMVSKSIKKQAVQSYSKSASAYMRKPAENDF